MKNQTKVLLLSILAFIFFLPNPGVSQSAETYFKEGESLSRAGNYEGAIAAYGKSIAADSTYFNAYLRRGFCYGLQQNYEMQLV